MINSEDLSILSIIKNNNISSLLNKINIKNKYYFIHFEWSDYCIFDFEINSLKREYYNEEYGKFKIDNNLLIINWDNWIGDDIFIEIDNKFYHLRILYEQMNKYYLEINYNNIENNNNISIINLYNINDKIKYVLDNKNNSIFKLILNDKIELLYIGNYKYYQNYLFIYNNNKIIDKYIKLENKYYNYNLLDINIKSIDNISNNEFIIYNKENEEGFVSDKITTEGIVSDKITTEGIVSDKITTEGIVSDKITTEGIVSDKITTEGIVSDKITTEGFVSNKTIFNKKYKIELFKKINNSYYYINNKRYKYNISNIVFSEKNLKQKLKNILNNNILLNNNYIDIENINNYIKSNNNNNLLEKYIEYDLYFEIPIKKNKRILSLVEWGYPPFGGGENWLLDLNKVFHKNNYDNYLMCFSDPFKNEYYQDINYIDLKYVKIIQMPKDLCLIIKMIKLIDPNIINHQGVYRELFMKISNVLEIPFLTGFCFWNDIIKFNIPEFNVGMINNNLLEKTDEFEKINNNSYTYISSDFVNDIINKLYNVKLDVIETISNKDNYIINLEDSNDIHNENQKIYVTIINCHYNKGGFLIKYLCDNLDYNIPLQIIYTENDPAIPFSYVEELMNTRNKFKNINILINGKIDIKDVYSKTKILLVPSICDETFCRVAYEGMMNNIPIISTRNGNLKYLLDNYAIFIDSLDCFIWKNEIEKLYFSDDLKDKFNRINFNIEDKIEKKIMNKITNITESKYKLNNNNIGLIIPWADQGLGIQSRDYYISLKMIGYNPHILSFKPYHATHDNIRLQIDKNEWDYKNIDYSSNYREDLTYDEVLSFVYKYNIKSIIIIEATYLNIFKIALFLKMLNVKIYLIINIECIRIEELNYHNIFDYILTNNIDSYNIINNLFPNKSKLLGFHLNYPYYNEINKYIKKNNNSKNNNNSKINTNNKLKFCCFGGLNSISRKNIILIIKSFFYIYNNSDLKNWELNIYIQGVEIPDIIDEYKCPNIFYHISHKSYKEIIEKYIENDISIHLGTHEGLGLGFYESLYTGTPMITIDWTPNNEIIKDNINGWIIKCDYCKVNDNNNCMIQMGLLNQIDLNNKIIEILTNINSTIDIINNTIQNKQFLYNKNKEIFENNLIDILK
jgi:hypothetical protein